MFGSSQNSYVEALIITVAVFKDEVSKEVIRLKCGALSQQDYCTYEKKKTSETSLSPSLSIFSFSLCFSICTLTQERPSEHINKKAVIYKLGRELSSEI